MSKGNNTDTSLEYLQRVRLHKANIDNHLGRNIVGSDIMKSENEPQQDQNLQKGMLGYDIEQGSKGNGFMFDKTGKEISQALNKKEKYLKDKMEACDMEKMRLAKKIETDAPLVDRTLWYDGGDKTYKGYPQEMEWYRESSDDSEYSSASSAKEAMYVRAFNRASEKKARLACDYDMVETLGANLDQNKKYKLSLRNLKELGF